MPGNVAMPANIAPMQALAFGDEGSAATAVSRAQPLPATLDGLLRPFRAVATFSRPADAVAYAIGDLIANSTTAASVTPLSFTAGRLDSSSVLRNANVLITSVRIIASSGAPAILPRFSLYGLAGPFALAAYPADNAALRGATGALTTAALELEQIVGEVTAWTQAASGLAYADIIPTVPLPVTTDTAGLVRGLLEARNAATPTSGLTYTAILRGLH